MIRYLPLLCLGLWGCTASLREPVRVSQVLAPVAPASARSTVLVLATPHLRELDKDFKPAAVVPVVDALERFRPSAICVEMLSAESLVGLEARGDAAARDMIDAFSRDGVAAGQATRGSLHVTRLEAQERARKLLSSKEVSDAQRGEAAVALVAAYELPSAILNWAYASEATRSELARTAPEAAAYLTSRLVRADEISQVVVPLAMRLGLSWLHGVDDHVDDEQIESLPEADFEDMLKSPLVTAVVQAPLYRTMRERLVQANARGNLLPVYTYVNSAEYLAPDVDTQWGLFWRIHHASGVDRDRYALWEARNLEIAARVARVSAMPAGGRVLVIFGASHKPFLDEALEHLVHVRRAELSDLP